MYWFDSNESSLFDLVALSDELEALLGVHDDILSEARSDRPASRERAQALAAFMTGTHSATR